MSKVDQNPTQEALDTLLSVGTVRGVCLGRAGEVLVNRFPFSDARLLNLCTEAEQVLKEFADHGRYVERMVFGFDGGHLVLLVEGDVRLLILHLIPDEADFVGKAGLAFLADHRESISGMAAMTIETESPPVEETPEVEAESESDDSDSEAEMEESVEVEVGVDLESTATGGDPKAAAAKNPQPVERESAHPVVARPDVPELSLDNLPPGEAESSEGLAFRDLLEASRQQQINDSVLAKSSDEEEVVERGEEDPEKEEVEEEDGSLAAWAAEHLELPEDTSHLLPPKQGSSRTGAHHSSTARAVVGAVRVQPVRLAAQQPQSTLPPPKKPRVRRSRESATESS